METSSRQPPRFVPTLTEVVRQPSQAEPTPAPAVLEDPLDLLDDDELTDEIALEFDPFENSAADALHPASARKSAPAAPAAPLVLLEADEELEAEPSPASEAAPQPEPERTLAPATAVAPVPPVQRSTGTSAVVQPPSPVVNVPASMAAASAPSAAPTFGAARKAAAAPAAVPTPAFWTASERVAFEERIVTKLLDQVVVQLDLRVREAVSNVVQAQTRALLPQLQEEVESVVRQTVMEAVSETLANLTPGASMPEWRRRPLGDR